MIISASSDAKKTAALPQCLGRRCVGKSLLGLVPVTNAVFPVILISSPFSTPAKLREGLNEEGLNQIVCYQAGIRRSYWRPETAPTAGSARRRADKKNGKIADSAQLTPKYGPLTLTETPPRPIPAI